MTVKNVLLILIALAAILFAAWAEPIAQDPAYHRFADQRTFLGVPNGYNVLSNALFVVSGVWGLVILLRLLRQGARGALVLEYGVFFAGVFLVGFGSAWYHLHPSDASLVWDRLPMTVAFMALLSSVISESISGKAGALLLAPLLVAGVCSVGYWAWTGDLRPYAVVQFLPLVLVPLMLLLYKTARSYRAYIWMLIFLYALSKLPEHFDEAIYSFGGLVSGHTLKHVLAALGTGCILRMLYNRKNELALKHK